MLTTQVLRQQLLELGFTPLGDTCYVDGDAVQACLLDGARLRLESSAAGFRYVAVLSAQHLAQEVAAFQGPLAPLAT